MVGFMVFSLANQPFEVVKSLCGRTNNGETKQKFVLA